MSYRSIAVLLRSGHCRARFEQGGIHTDNLQRSHAAEATDDAHELAAGLMLMRASTLKMLRLQLALARSDRRAVLEAVDELAELDNRLQDCLAGVPGLGTFAQELEAERSSFNREKLTLVSGVTGPAERSRPESSERPCFAFEEAAAPAPHVVDPVQLQPAPDLESDEAQRRSYRWVAVLAVIISVCAGEAYLFGGFNALARLASATGAFQ